MIGQDKNIGKDKINRKDVGWGESHESTRLYGSRLSGAIAVIDFFTSVHLLVGPCPLANFRVRIRHAARFGACR
jgi:hypothetical protein